jgi:hypothetical protein
VLALRRYMVSMLLSGDPEVFTVLTVMVKW